MREAWKRGGRGGGGRADLGTLPANRIKCPVQAKAKELNHKLFKAQAKPKPKPRTKNCAVVSLAVSTGNTVVSCWTKLRCSDGS